MTFCFDFLFSRRCFANDLLNDLSNALSHSFMSLCAFDDACFWQELGNNISISHSERAFRGHFGLSSIALLTLWRLLLEHPLPHLWGGIELLQALHHLKDPGSSWTTSASRVGVDKQTFKKNFVLSLHLLDQCLPEVTFKIIYYILISML